MKRIDTLSMPMFLYVLKAKLACHPASCLLPVAIIDRCGLATAILIALLIR